METYEHRIYINLVEEFDSDYARARQEKAGSRGVSTKEEFLMAKRNRRGVKHPATKKRGADPQVPPKSKRETSLDPLERKLEQGLEESMAGSNPVSITQPASTKADKE